MPEWESEIGEESGREKNKRENKRDDEKWNGAVGEGKTAREANRRRVRTTRATVSLTAALYYHGIYSSAAVRVPVTAKNVNCRKLNARDTAMKADQLRTETSEWGWNGSVTRERKVPRTACEYNATAALGPIHLHALLRHVSPSKNIYRRRFRRDASLMNYA